MRDLCIVNEQLTPSTIETNYMFLEKEREGQSERVDGSEREREGEKGTKKEGIRVRVIIHVYLVLKSC